MGAIRKHSKAEQDLLVRQKAEIAAGRKGEFLAKAKKDVKRAKQTDEEQLQTDEESFLQLDTEERTADRRGGVTSCRTYKVKKTCEFDFGIYKHPNFKVADIVNVGSNGGTSIVCAAL